MSQVIIALAPYIAAILTAYTAYIKVKQDTSVRKQSRDTEIELIKKDITSLQNTHADFKKDIADIKEILSKMSADIAVLKSKTI